MREAPSLPDGRALDLADLNRTSRCSEFITNLVGPEMVEFRPVTLYHSEQDDTLTVVNFEALTPVPGPLVDRLVKYFA